MSNSSYTPNTGVTAPIDPGWNDPPKLTFNAQQTTPNKPRNMLNKRVAFPLSNTMASPVAMPPVNLPPMPVPAPAPPMPTPANTQADEVNIDSENTLKEVKEILLRLLEDSTELDSKANDIRRRIGVMEDMWTTGKLDKRIQLHMGDMAHALQNNTPSKADDIHRILMVDYVSVVGTWMPGIKLLIRNSIARNELLSIDKE